MPGRAFTRGLGLGDVEVRRPISYSGQGFSPRGEKSRFVLPPQFRKDVKESSGGTKTLCLAKHERWPCLTGFGLSRCDTFDAQIDREQEYAERRGEFFDRDLRATQLWGFIQVPFDDSGRFVIPDHLAGLAELDDLLFFQGGGAFFTIWNPEQIAKMGAGWEGAQAACTAFMADAANGKGRK